MMRAKTVSGTKLYPHRLRMMISFPILCTLLLTLVATFAIPTQKAEAATYPGKIGAEALPEFVDLMKTTRPWEATTTGATFAVDANAWPTTDAKTVVFDERPCCPFFPEPNFGYDDPDNWHSDMSGTYKLSFTGQADISSGEDTGSFTVANKTYNSGTNTTTADIVMNSGKQLMVLVFTNTKRTASSAVGTGITNAKLIRPGYPANTTQVFTTRFLKSLAPYSTLRYMGAMDTNRNPGYYGDPGHHALEWSQRHVPSDATQQSYSYPATGDKYGIAWEYLIDVANLLDKDIWINIPVAATPNYMQQLASFMHTRLETGRKVYIEHSNEVWNYAFGQYIYNKLAAVDEVNQGGSNLNNDGSTDQEEWARRRHAKQLKLAGDAFRNAFTDDSRVRPVLAWWVLYPDQYSNMLTWINNNYGNPQNFFYATGGTGYFSFHGASETATVDQLLQQVITNSDNGRARTVELVNVAASRGLKYLAYEGTMENLGSDGQSETNIANRVRAMRDPRVAAIVTHHLVDNWFTTGADLFMYFTSKGNNQRFGFYGATEDYRDLYGPQLQAIRAVLNQSQPNNPAPDDTSTYHPGGLTGTYYNTSNLSGTVAGVRVDATIDFSSNGATTPMAHRVNAENFSVRWTGQVEAPASGNYTFTTVTDDGIRVWLDNQLIINNWTGHAPTTDNSAAIALTAGRKYPIKIEYYNGCCGRAMQLKWSYPNQGSQIIPQRYLYPRTAALDRAGWTASASLNNGAAGSAIDTSTGSRWTTNQPQSSSNGAWFQVDMQTAKTFAAVNLDSVNSAGDSPGTYTVAVSNNGTSWTTVATGNSFGPLTTAVFSPQTARYIRVTLNSTTRGTWWGINDFNVLNYNASFSY